MRVLRARTRAALSRHLHEGRSVKVRRIQDPEFELNGYYAKTARKCTPFCIHPMQAVPGVATFGEVELFDFMWQLWGLTTVVPGR